jgi:DNA-binding NtrC family response regulator
MHAWPGNVRELKNAIERASALAPGPAITAYDLEFLSQQSAEQPPLLSPHMLDMQLPEALEQLERAMICHALALTAGNRTDAARRLGISRQSLYTKMSNLSIS